METIIIMSFIAFLLFLPRFLMHIVLMIKEKNNYNSLIRPITENIKDLFTIKGRIDDFYIYIIGKGFNSTSSWSLRLGVFLFIPILFFSVKIFIEQYFLKQQTNYSISYLYENTDNIVFLILFFIVIITILIGLVYEAILSGIVFELLRVPLLFISSVLMIIVTSLGFLIWIVLSLFFISKVVFKALVFILPYISKVLLLILDFIRELTKPVYRRY